MRLGHTLSRVCSDKHVFAKAFAIYTSTFPLSRAGPSMARASVGGPLLILQDARHRLSLVNMILVRVSREKRGDMVWGQRWSPEKRHLG